MARGPLRHTPAGIPVTELELHHSSVQHEAGLDRQIAFELAAVAMGELAHRCQALKPGAAALFEGFLAPRRRGSTVLVLHVQKVGSAPTLQESAA